MSEKLLRLGIVGCGAIGRCHVRAALMCESIRIVALCDSNIGSAEALARELVPDAECFEDMTRLFASDIDAVAICLPTRAHCTAVKAAADAGKHILREKPLSDDYREATETVRYCEEKGIQLGVVFQHRYDDGFRALKDAISAPDSGRILFAECRSMLFREHEYYADAAWRRTAGNGALINQAIHYIDLLTCLLKAPVSAYGRCFNRCHKDIESEDLSLAVLEFEGGVPATVSGTTAAFPGLYNELSVYCENASYTVRNDRLFAYFKRSGTDERLEALIDRTALYTDHRDAAIEPTNHAKLYRAFADALLCGKRVPISGEKALYSLRAIDGICRSAECGERILL